MCHPLTPPVPRVDGTTRLIYMDDTYTGATEEDSHRDEGIGDDDDQQAVSLEVSIPYPAEIFC